MTEQCMSRLQKELKDIQKETPPGLRAAPLPSNLLEWHYVLEGSDDSEYAGGWYHGKIIFPRNYPFRPPSIIMCTPSGRFEPGARICLSLSDYHPESWTPVWNVRLILLGLQSFFYESTFTTGACMGVSDAEKRRLAAQSLAYNAGNPSFRILFPDLVELHESKRKEKEEPNGENGHANDDVGDEEETNQHPEREDVFDYERPNKKRKANIDAYYVDGDLHGVLNDMGAIEKKFRENYDEQGFERGGRQFVDLTCGSGNGNRDEPQVHHAGASHSNIPRSKKVLIENSDTASLEVVDLLTSDDEK